MRSVPCPRDTFCQTRETARCPVVGANSVNFICDDETYIRMVLCREHWVNGGPDKAALTIDAVIAGASGNRMEMLTPSKYAEVAAGREVFGFFAVNAGEARALETDKANDAGFLFCPLQDGVYPETHVDLRFRTRFDGNKPPKSWRSLRDKLFLACQSYSSIEDVFST